KVLGVVFLLLRVGQGQQRAFKPDGLRGLEFLARLDAGAEHLERARLEQVQAADADVHGLAALPARRKDVRRDRGISAKNGAPEAQRGQRKQKTDWPATVSSNSSAVHRPTFLFRSSLCSLCLCGPIRFTTIPG